MSWLRPWNSSRKVRRPCGVSKTYSLSTLTHGSARRAALSWSRRRVSSFSFVSKDSRAASHSSLDTTVWGVWPVGTEVWVALMARLLSWLDDSRTPPRVGNRQLSGRIQFIRPGSRHSRIGAIHAQAHDLPVVRRTGGRGGELLHVRL